MQLKLSELMLITDALRYRAQRHASEAKFRPLSGTAQYHEMMAEKMRKLAGQLERVKAEDA